MTYVEGIKSDQYWSNAAITPNPSGKIGPIVNSASVSVLQNASINGLVGRISTAWQDFNRHDDVINLWVRCLSDNGTSGELAVGATGAEMKANCSVNNASVPSSEGDMDPQLHMVIGALTRLAYLASCEGRNVLSSSMYLAKRVIRSVPKNRALPQVDIDEDANILLAWRQPSRRISLVLLIERQTLLWVINPGSDSIHVEPQVKFDQLDEQLLSQIPYRNDLISYRAS